MTRHAQGTFSITAWDESTWEGKTWKEGTPPMLTHARITQTFTGDFEGDGESQALMAYAGQGAVYVGMMRLVGKLGGRSGTALLQWEGSYANDQATVRWSVVPGSATGALAGLTGSGGYTAGHGMNDIAYTLDYALD